MAKKNPHAVSLGRLGGEARAISTTLKERREWGSLGGQTRAARYDKATLSEWAKKGGRPKGSGKKSTRGVKHAKEKK